MNVFSKEFLTKLNLEFKKGLLIIHNDMDGRGCEILGKCFFPSRFDYVILNAGETDKTLANYLRSNKYDLIIMADLSFKEKETLELVKKFNDSGKQFFLVDHHDLAMDYSKYPWAFVSIATDGVRNSGTELLYHFFCKQSESKNSNRLKKINNDILKELVELIRSYDTWDWFKTNNLKAKDLAQLFEYKHEEFVKNIVSRIRKNTSYLLSEKDIMTLEVLNNVNKSYAKKTSKERYDFNYHGFKYTLVVANQLQGLVANEIFAEDDSIEMIVFIVTVKKLSFRSTDDKFDTLVFSKSLGGNGHRNASGCDIPKDVVEYMLNNILGNNDKQIYELDEAIRELKMNPKLVFKQVVVNNNEIDDTFFGELKYYLYINSNSSSYDYLTYLEVGNGNYSNMERLEGIPFDSNLKWLKTNEMDNLYNKMQQAY